MKRNYYVGQRFTANISGKDVKGKIQIENGVIYLCQNEKDGFQPSSHSMFGYKYAWNIKDGSDEELVKNQVKDLVLITNVIEYKDWQVGDRLELHDEILEVIFRSGELTVLKNGDNEATTNYTCDELYEHGARLFIPEVTKKTSKVVELTLAQIATKFNISVEELRVKD